jgi:hypothetical protein
VKILPSLASAVALACAVAGNALADPFDPAQLFEVDVDHLAGGFLLIANHGRPLLKRRQKGQVLALADARHGCTRYSFLRRDLRAGLAAPAQRLYPRFPHFQRLGAPPSGRLERSCNPTIPCALSRRRHL